MFLGDFYYSEFFTFITIDGLLHFNIFSETVKISDFKSLLFQ